MLPVIALVGRPNVGKSTLFNCLTKTKDALVVDLPGTTRDRLYGEAIINEQKVIICDTGGVIDDNTQDNALKVDSQITNQTWQAVDDADVVLFVVEAQAGLIGADIELAQLLRKTQKPVFVIVNKVDGLDIDQAMADFYELGIKTMLPVSAKTKRGLGKVRTLIAESIHELTKDLEPTVPETEENKAIKIALIGRPNVGKSTLTNRLLGEQRVIAFDESGTTRDSVYIPMQRHGKNYTLIDTAGIRKRAKTKIAIDKFSVIKSLKAIEECDVALLLFDARTGVLEQDLHLLDFILQSGTACILLFNKWDNLTPTQQKDCKQSIKERLNFFPYAEQLMISALEGSNVGLIWKAVNKAYKSASLECSASTLTDILEQAQAAHQPPLVKGRRVKLQYAHQGGKFPLTVVIHGAQTENLAASYKKFLSNFYTKSLKLVGSAARVLFKTKDNPYKDKKNIITERQLRKRKRLMKHVRKKK